MSYRCEVCRACVGSGPRRLHVVSRDVPYRTVTAGYAESGTRREIAREIPVCGTCAVELAHVPLAELVARHAAPRPRPIPVEPVYVPPPVAPPPSQPGWTARLAAITGRKVAGAPAG